MASSVPVAASRDCATTSAFDWPSSSPARARPTEKISKAVPSTSVSITKATSTSISVNPFSFTNRNPPRQPIDIDQVLYLPRRNRDAPARGAAVRIEANRAALVARDLGLRGVELEIDAVAQLVGLGFSGGGVLARL